MTLTLDQPLRTTASPEFAKLRIALRQAAYTAANLDTLLFGATDTTGAQLEIAVALRRVRGNDPLATLIRLFRLRVGVHLDDAQQALSPASLDGLADLGLITIDQDVICSSWNLYEYQSLYLISDRKRTERDELTFNHVTGVNGTSMALASITIRRQVEWALDLGTGCGVQALLASRHAQRVVATDLNPRCLNLTAFNARLNGVDTIECRQGSFFEPVSDMKFDLIVTNPPYVISPESRYQFRDGGKPGDTLVEQVARQLPQFLRPGGFATLLGNWVVESEDEWTEPPRRWLSDAGCDVVALHYCTEDPISYAAKWLKPQCVAHPEEYAPGVDRWLAYYENQGIRAIGTGGLVLRRQPAKSNWFHGYSVAHGHGPCGDQLLRIFAMQDYLNSLSTPDALLERCLRLDGNHRLEQVLDYESGGYRFRSCRLALNDGLAFTGTIDPDGMQHLSSCDGSVSLRDVLASLARHSNTPLEELTQRSLPMVRKLMLMGFLTPVDF